MSTLLIAEGHPLYHAVAATMAADKRMQCDDPNRAASIMLPLLYPKDGSGEEVERVAVMGIGRRGGVVDKAVLTVGSDAHTVVSPQQIYRWALTRSRPVTAIVMAHNHPSGNPEPSSMDIEVTRAVVSAGKVVGIRLADHLVFGGIRWTSIAQRWGVRGVL